MTETRRNLVSIFLLAAASLAAQPQAVPQQAPQTAPQPAPARGRGPGRAPIPQQLTFTPYHASGIYDVGETVGWTVTPGPVTPTYAYKWTIRRNNNVVLKEGKLDLSAGKDKIEIAGDQPAMIYVAIEAYADLAPAPVHSRPRARGCCRAGGSRPRPGVALYGRQYRPQ